MSPANRANSAPLWEAVGNNGVCQLRPPPTSQNLAHTAIPLILAVPAVVLPIATEDARNAAVGVGALELAGQADVNVWEREKERSQRKPSQPLHTTSATKQPSWLLGLSQAAALMHFPGAAQELRNLGLSGTSMCL